jgi:hypothetical protein
MPLIAFVAVGRGSHTRLVHYTGNADNIGAEGVDPKDVGLINMQRRYRNGSEWMKQGWVLCFQTW